MKLLGDGFIKLIKMFIVLIVFCVVVNGIFGVGDLKKVGCIGLKLVIYFEIFIIIVLVFGLVVVYSLGLGSGVNIYFNELFVGDVVLYIGCIQEIYGFVVFFMGLILIFVFSVFVENDIFQVLLFFVLFGSVLNLVGEQVSGVVCLINEFSYIVFCIMGMIVCLVLFGVFGVVVFIIVCYGVDLFSYLGVLVLVFYVICLVFVMVVFGSVLCFFGVCMLLFLCYFCEELLIVMGIVFFDVVLLQVMCKFEYMGICSFMVGLVIFIGYLFNFDGFLIYLILVVVFIVYVIGMLLVMIDLIIILLVLLVIFKGVYGIFGLVLVIFVVIFIVVLVILVVGLVLVFLVDWFMGIGCVLINLIGNCVVIVIIVCWENDIDMLCVQVIFDGCLEVLVKVDGELFKCSVVVGEGKLYG